MNIKLHATHMALAVELP